jgi:hypothetical protein
LSFLYFSFKLTKVITLCHYYCRHSNINTLNYQLPTPTQSISSSRSIKMRSSLLPRLRKSSTQIILQNTKRSLPKPYSRAFASKSAAPPVSENTTSREDLTARILPQMKLSKGDGNSLTPPPRAIPDSVSPEGKAKKRFEVEGNAM